ncbi:iron uptake porin [Dolichospermum circinale CS-1225]|uniref:Iron uptake porin n=1 Tax=Dolichospermum circinale CS-537/01 TaxID=3021739 RepID=A0ABT5A8K8_9CYAN|nr:iron uptake porin [Dolichospermum circinale]MDB9487783.1 iron uptake porin [Dolichospermum circinale CS-537/01]MDB9520819.1 iron uptake porin [Dolichospermum circinale CS-1225]
MKKAFWNILKVSPAVALTLLAGNSAFAGEVNGKVTSVAELSQESNNLSQVTSVSQFSDVQPTDWAFQALQSLVERYGCAAGYPNGTFRGNRALSRYEFAAGLNSCLDRVNELIATATADLVTKQDLATLQRLQEEFSTELATLRGQVDALEARTGELEANQFSTTTKLSGEAIFSVSQAFGDKVAVQSSSGGTRPTTDLNSNATFSDRVRLSLNSSFTGTDQLQTRLQGINIIPNSGLTGTNMTRLGYDGSASGNNSNNTVTIDKLNYAFNLKNNIRVRIDATGAELNENVNVFNPDFRSSGSGALSRYGRFSPIYRQAVDGAGITVNVNPNGKLGLSAAYFATGRDNNANNPAPGTGLFGGNNTMFGQLALKPNPAINIGLTYAHTYQSGTPNLFGNTGSIRANTLGLVGSNKIEASNYGIQGTLQPTKNITIGGWGGYTAASTLTGNSTNGEIWYWAATLGIKDFIKEGNTLGLIVGQSPKLTGGTVRTGATTSNITRDFNTSYHIEGLYKMKLSDNILVTPGVIVILNPEHNDKNSAEYVGTLRTTFTF